MRRPLCTSLAAVCLFALAGCGASFEEYKSAEGQFKISFPGKPKEQTQPGPGFTMKAVTVEGRNGAYVAAFGDMPIPEKEPPAKIDDRLDGAVQGMATTNAGTIKSSNKITINGKYPGREFEIAITRPKQGTVRGKVFLKGRRLYQVFALGTDSFASSGDATKFLDSFALTE
jgi:hypothetical protein